MIWDAIADIRREASGCYERGTTVGVNVASLASLAEVMNDAVGLVSDEKLGPVTAFNLCGIEVKEDSRVPDGMAMIVSGDEIINIIRYA